MLVKKETRPSQHGRARATPRAGSDGPAAGNGVVSRPSAAAVRVLSLASRLPVPEALVLLLGSCALDCFPWLSVSRPVVAPAATASIAHRVDGETWMMTAADDYCTVLLVASTGKGPCF
jgi:hypothetical protein